MARALARTRKRYTPLDLAYSSSVSGALNQNYDASYQTYDPDRGLVPLEILFTVRATDPKKVNPGVINSKLTNVKWYENVVDEAHNITDSNTAYVIDRNGNTDSRGKITVKKNTPLEGVVLIFTAKYTDPRSGKVINVNATISLGVTVSTDEPLRVKVDYPYGQVVDPTENRDIIEVDNILYRGDSEYEGSIYRWSKKEGGDYTGIEEGDNGITGAYTGKLKVPCAAVGKRMDLRCVADVLPDLAGVNLISKKMISGDWNAIAAGISTPGEDADGKYFVINQQTLYENFGRSKKDLFGEKIKYKSNQRYRFDVRWKLQGEQNDSGLIFTIIYTDDSNKSISIPSNQTSIKVSSLVTAEGKTIAKITSNYGGKTYLTNLYDLQLVEYHGENLVTGRSKERRVTQYTSLYKVTEKKTFTLYTGKSEFVSGVDSRKHMVIIYDHTASKIVSNTGYAEDGKTIVLKFAVDNVDFTHDLDILLYSRENSSSGTIRIFHDLMLVEGEYTDETMPAYTPATDEFVPAIADGGERWQESTSRAITTDHVLSTQYPKCNTEIVAPSMILDDTSLFEASVVMHSSRGDIANPQLFWSFPWKDKTGAIFARGSKIFIKEEQFENDEFDYSVDPVEGLDEAKWAASFNGIDQYSSNNNPTNIYPWGYGNKRTHVLDFIVDAYNSLQIPCSMIFNDFGFVPSVSSTGMLTMYVKDKLAVSTPYTAPAFKVEPGKMYRLEVSITVDGEFTIKVNGVRVGTTFENAGTWKNGITIGKGPGVNYFNGKVLRYEIFNEDKSVYHLWDFQPTGGDRANMLKNKNEDGSVKGTSNLTPVNVPGIDNVDPENGFFVTI